MFVRSRPSRTRWAISLNWSRSDSTTKATARPSAGRASAGPTIDASGPGSRTRPASPLPDVTADDIEHHIDFGRRLRGRRADRDRRTPSRQVEHRLTVGTASGADDVGAGLSCERQHHRARRRRPRRAPRRSAPPEGGHGRTVPAGRSARDRQARAHRKVDVASNMRCGWRWVWVTRYLLLVAVSGRRIQQGA